MAKIVFEKGGHNFVGELLIQTTVAYEDGTEATVSSTYNDVTPEDTSTLVFEGRDAMVMLFQGPIWEVRGEASHSEQVQKLLSLTTADAVYAAYGAENRENIAEQLAGLIGPGFSVED